MNGTQSLICTEQGGEQKTEENSGECTISVYLQVADFVRGDDDTAESTGILDNSDRVHLLETLIHHARPADVRESCVRRRELFLACSNIRILSK